MMMAMTMLMMMANDDEKQFVQNLNLDLVHLLLNIAQVIACTNTFFCV